MFFVRESLYTDISVTLLAVVSVYYIWFRCSLIIVIAACSLSSPLLLLLFTMSDSSSSAAPAAIDPQAIIQELQRLGSITLQLQQQSLSASSAAAGSAASSASAHRRVDKPMQPKAFTNERGGIHIDYWIGNMERYFRAIQGTMTPREQVNYAATYLHDAAGQWWDTVSSTVTDWPSMQKKLLERYRPVSASQVARDQLDSFKQRGSVNNYSDIFRTLVNRIDGMNAPALEETVVHAFIRGLHPTVKMEVHRENPLTLEKAMSSAQRAEQRLAQNFRNRTSFFPSSASSSSSSFAGARSSATESAIGNYGSAPMELSAIDAGIGNESELLMMYAAQDNPPVAFIDNAVQSQLHQLQQSFANLNNRFQQRNGSARTKQRVPGLSKEDQQKLFAAGKCFKCREEGHIARNCSKK